MKNVSPMKNKPNRRHSDSYERALERSEAHKASNVYRKQGLRNKRLRMSLGA